MILPYPHQTNFIRHCRNILEEPGLQGKIVLSFRDSLIIIRDCLERAQSRRESTPHVDAWDAARLISTIGIGLQLSAMLIDDTDEKAARELWIGSAERILLIDRPAG